MIHGLFIGCDYRGEDCELEDCSIDALNIASALERYVASGRQLVNEAAGRDEMLAEFATLKSRMKRNDVAIVSFSGHGTSDEIGGKQYQGIVCNDLELIYEWELRQLVSDLGQAVLIADCCFAGGLPRGTRRSRFVPIRHCFRRLVTPPGRPVKRPHATYLACKANETAASTGKGGAFTIALLEAFADVGIKTTFTALHKGIRKLLPSREYAQTPQFVCSDKAFANRTLSSFNRRWNQMPKGAA